MQFLNARAWMVPAAGVLACAAVAAATETRIAEGVAYRCLQGAPAELRCDYRFLEPALATGISARLGDRDLEISGETSFPGTGATVAVLIIVDTSDPGRADVIARNIDQVAQLVDAAKPHYRLGLARFDSDLEMLAPIGSSADEIKSAARGLAAVGMTTELYRSTLEAVRRIAAYAADRRVLFIFSDGLAEDRAYEHTDVIRAARESGVALYSVGFPRSVSLSVALQSLRRLSEDSGGRFVAASDLDFSLPSTFMSDPYGALDSGGAFTVSLSAAVEAGATGTREAEISLQTARGVSRLPVPVDLPAAAAPPAGPYTQPPPLAAPPGTAALPGPAAGGPASAPPSRAGQPASAGYGTVNTWLWYGTPAAFLVIVVVALLLYGRIWRQRAAVLPSAAVQAKPFAYLIRDDDQSVRYVITQSPWRIGRSRNNDLTLDDHSVSRQHAEIHRKADGSFTVTDLESLNGVFVNDKKVQASELHEGDGLDVGDVNLRFTLYDNDYAAQEPTVMLHTHTP